MKNLVRIAAAGVLIAGYHTAMAQQATAPATQPSSDSADLWLFVSDQAAGTTFAEDTGIAISSIMPAEGSSSYVSNASLLSGVFTASINEAADSALASYISSNGASNLEWGIEAVQYDGTQQTGYKKPGGIIGITDNNLNPLNTAALQAGNVTTWGSGFEGDIQNFIAPTYTAGGTVYSFSNGTPGGSVWGAATGNTGGSTDLYGQGPNSAGIGLGTSVPLYGVTGNNGTGTVQSYILGDLELTVNGTLETISAVPLPAAVWLFASGLLGLAGVGRRRSTAA